MGFFKSVVNKAIREEIVSYKLHPFINHTHRPHKNKKVRALTVDQIKAVMQVADIKPKTEYYRDMFIFQVLAGGMRVRDLITLRWENIYINENGFYLRYTQSKGSGKDITSKLSIKALEFLSIPLISVASKEMEGVLSAIRLIKLEQAKLEKVEREHKYDEYENEYVEEYKFYDAGTNDYHTLKGVKMGEIKRMNIKQNIRVWQEDLMLEYTQIFKKLHKTIPNDFIFNRLMHNVVLPNNWQQNLDDQTKITLQGKIKTLNYHLKLICKQMNIPKITTHHAHNSFLTFL